MEDRPRPATWLTNPWVAGAGLILALLSVALNVYLYQITKRERGLAYYVNPVRTIVLKKGAASGLRVLHGSEEINSDVTAAQIAVWNRGREPIRSADILSSVQIITKPPTRILEATVRKETRPVIGLTIDVAHLVEGKLPISWRILERSDGGVIQLLLAGPVDTDLVVEGVIEGQKRISIAVEEVTSSPLYRTLILALYGLIVGLSLLNLALEVGVGLRQRQPIRLRRPLLYFAVAVLALLVVWFINRPQGPPFEL